MAGIKQGSAEAVRLLGRFNATVQRTVFLAAHILLALLVLYQCWRILNLAFLDVVPSMPESGKAAVVSNVIAAQKREKNIELLIQSHVFGEELSVSPVRPVIEQAVARPSTRDYRIASLAHSNDPKKSSVVLEVTPGEMKFLKPGEAIEQGIVLLRTASDGVLINAHGQAEKIEYIRVPVPVLIKTTEGAQSLTTEVQEFDWAWVSQWKSLPDSAILQRLHIEKRGGVYVIQAGSPLLSNWNVKAGDVLLSINGTPLGGAVPLKSAFEPLTLAATVNLLVENSRRRNMVRWSRGRSERLVNFVIQAAAPESW